MRKGLLFAYLGVAALCLAAPYATGSRGMADALLPYTGGPFALASVALALDASSKLRHGWLKWLTLVTWAAAAIPLSAQLSSPPLELKDVFRAIELRALLAGAGALGLMFAAFRWPDEASVVQRIARGLALVAVAGLLGWFCLMGLYIVPSGGLAAVATGLHITQLVLTGAAAILVLAGPIGRVGLVRWGRRRTRG